MFKLMLWVQTNLNINDAVVIYVGHKPDGQLSNVDCAKPADDLTQHLAIIM
jgi:hypothetical protein